jgi:hypothetical protein
LGVEYLAKAGMIFGVELYPVNIFCDKEQGKDVSMGWARTLILGDVGNRLDISDCEKDIKVLKTALMEMNQDDRSQDQELINLRRESDELKLYLSAIIRLLTAKKVLAPEELKKMVDAVDAEDGAMDGKIRP